MIQLYTWTTPNGIKPLIMLEELGIPYETTWVNIRAGAQHEPSYRAINPNGKIPSLVDGDLQIFESGAILIHLAEKSGRFLAASGQARIDTLAWLFFQVGGVGPMFGQYGHFSMASEPIPYAIDRYRDEARRLLGVLEGRLSDHKYLAGEYSIADIAMVGWVSATTFLKLSLDDFPAVAAWLARVEARPAVQRAKAMKPPE